MKLAAASCREFLLAVLIAFTTSSALSASRTNQPHPAAPLFAQAVALYASNQFAAARLLLGEISRLPDAAAEHLALAALETARCHEREGNIAAAKIEYARVARVPGVWPHHREEAERHQARLSGLLPNARAQRRPFPKAGLELFVATNGTDASPGTRAQPFATIRRARDAVCALRVSGSLPAGGVAVSISAGSYPVLSTLQLSADDSGTASAPIVYRAFNGSPVLSGGTVLRGFELVRAPAELSRIPAEAHGKVMKLNLRAAGVTNILPLQLGGFASGRGFKTHPNMELFYNGAPMQLARWPNDGFVTVTHTATNDGHRIHNIPGTKRGLFGYEGNRPERWKNEPDIRVYGYWFWDWADSYEKVAAIDTEKREITLEPPFHTYGYRKGQPFHALNLLSELDQPGEWYLDRRSADLFFWPPGDLRSALVEISTAPFTMLEVKGASHVRFEGLTWDLGSADAIEVAGGENVMLAGCTVRRFAGSGITVNGGKGHSVVSCDIHSLGRGAIRISGGDRKTLTRGGHLVENCHIHDLSRIDHTYTPAVGVSGVGHRIANNLAHHIRSSAINLGGNDHLVEFNEAGRVVQESDDQGAVDMWGNPTFRGNVFRWNYFHHIGPWKNARTQPALGQAGIRLDDAISGVLIYGNIFRHAATGKHAFGGVQIHGGKDNILDRNLFADCAQAITFSPWGEKRWLEHLARHLPSKEIDLPLYTNRYPDMARIATGADINRICRNQFINCGRVLKNDRGSHMLGNHELSGTNSISSVLARYPVPRDSMVMEDIPFGLIGLYQDEFRREIPAKLISELREDR